MTTKQTNNFFKELGDVLRVVGMFIADVLTRLWNWISSWKWKTIRLYIGAVITVLAAVMLAVDVITGILLLTGPSQVAQIVYALCGVHIFSYVSAWQYVGFITGGLIMDVAFWTIVMWLGIYWWKGVNYFVAPRYAWLYAGAVAMAGFTLMAGSVFYALPGLIEMHETHHDKYHKKHLMQVWYGGNGYGNRYERPMMTEERYYQAQRETEQMQQDMDRYIDQLFNQGRY